MPINEKALEAENKELNNFLFSKSLKMKLPSKSTKLIHIQTDFQKTKYPQSKLSNIII